MAVVSTEEDKTKDEVNPLSLSDEAFMDTMVPAVASEEAPAAEVPVATVEAEKVAEPAIIDPKTTEEPKTKEAEAAPAAAAAEKTAAPVADPKDPLVVGEAAVIPEGDKVAAEEKPVDFEGFYKQIMTPFKANGKTIELKDPAEAVQLMQMGANYTRKMQELVPHRKVLTMLQNNGLLDESKLSFLIDLDKKDPEAIKKLIKDSGVDPLEIDTNVEPAYLEGNHRVSDEEVNFRATLDELGSNQEGRDTLQAINTRWDQASKETLWKSPETMAVIHAQREAGLYDRIVAEMDRQTTLGKLPPETPFLRGYKIVGDELTAANAFQDLKEKFEKTSTPAPEAPAPEEPKVVATRVGTPKSSVTNDDKASAASPSRSTPPTAKEFVNPLAMADDEFLKTFNGRL